MSHVFKKKKIKDKNENKMNESKKVEDISGELEREGERIYIYIYIYFFFFFSSLLSKIYRNRTVGFHWSKRQSRSTHRELRVDTKILEFRQTPRGKKFFYLCYF